MDSHDETSEDEDDLSDDDDFASVDNLDGASHSFDKILLLSDEYDLQRRATPTSLNFQNWQKETQNSTNTFKSTTASCSSSILTVHRTSPPMMMEMKMMTREV
jgi:hypothetical protein